MFHFHEDGKCIICGAFANISCDNCGGYVCGEHISMEIALSKNRVLHICERCSSEVLKKMGVGKGNKRIGFSLKQIVQG